MVVDAATLALALSECPLKHFGMLEGLLNCTQ
jgi:hypothetical protein